MAQPPRTWAAVAGDSSAATAAEAAREPQTSRGRAGNLAFGLASPPPPARPELISTGTLVALLVAAGALIGAALIAGGSGSPRFSLGLAFGVAIGAVPCFLIFAADLCRPYLGDQPPRRRRRLSQEEWQRIFDTGPAAGGSQGTTFSGRSSTGAGWTASQERTGRREAADQLSRAYDLLGVSENASIKEVTVAYHRLAHQVHPDKVVGEDEQARLLAERRMKDLNAAYTLLRKWLI